jgi:hypothetical protein
MPPVGSAPLWKYARVPRATHRLGAASVACPSASWPNSTESGNAAAMVRASASGVTGSRVLLI